MSLIWIATTVMVLALLIFAFLMRYFIHIERMALIQQGYIPSSIANPIFRRGSFGLLLAGLITAFSGVGLFLGLYFGLGKGFWLAGGYIPMGVGVALILAYLFGGHSGAPEERPSQKEVGIS
jgi:hypothetical protein